MVGVMTAAPSRLQVQFSRFGEPGDVLEIVPLGELQAIEGQALVKLLASPINPADVNTVQGIYGIKPALPAVPGMEACGEVVSCPGGELAPGTRVIFLRRGGAWATETLVPVGSLLPVPEDMDPEQASMLGVNPLTALRLMEGFRSLKEGDWIVQNAANSNVGRCVIQLARERGVSTINLVRRPELREELVSLGATVVLEDDPDMVAAALEASGGARPGLAFNAVGGDSALRQMDLLARRGIQVTYGAMGRRSLKVPNKFLIFKELTLTGFWLSQWLNEASGEERNSSYAALAQLVMDGKLQQAVERTYPLREAKEACRRAQTGGRDGKVLLVP